MSCLAFSPDLGGVASGLLAAGTYEGSVGIFDSASYQMALLLHGHRGGVTQVLWSRCGNYLYTGARKDGDIICWDVRFQQQEVYRMDRDTKGTNQRIQFDIEPEGRHLATGGEDGQLRVFQLSDGKPVASFPFASDTVNGFAYHPFGPLAASSSGQRRYPNDPDRHHAHFASDESDDQLPSGSHQGQLTGLWNALMIWRFPFQWAGPQGGTTADS